jgi:hypothetical protein
MFRLLLSSLLAVVLLCNPVSAQKDKDTPKKDAPAKEEPTGVKVKIKSVDAKTGTLVVTTAEGKAITFKVDEKAVKILGPRGGMSEGFKDDRMVVGKELTLFYGADNKTLKEIRFAVRQSEPEKDKPVKDKPAKDK